MYGSDFVFSVFASDILLILTLNQIKRLMEKKSANKIITVVIVIAVIFLIV